jgi:hypothetical protein
MMFFMFCVIKELISLRTQLKVGSIKEIICVLCALDDLGKSKLSRSLKSNKLKLIAIQNKIPAE